MTTARDTAKLAPLPTDVTKLWAWLPNSGWTALPSAVRVENIAATSAGQTSFAVPNGYTPGLIFVFYNGVFLQPADYTATDGANIVLAAGATGTSDVMNVVALGAIRTMDDALASYTVATLPAASANARKIRWCSNMAGQAAPVYSDGTNWRRMSDDSIVTT